MTIDPRQLRDALGCFATGVTVVTTLTEEGEPAAVTVNSFTSLSLDPPLVLFCLGRAAHTFDAFRGATAFAVNVLGEDQKDLSVRFSSRHCEDRWSGVATEVWDTGVPILKGSLAVLECDREATHEGGDHVILVGRVRRVAKRAVGAPLVYFRGNYATLG